LVTANAPPAFCSSYIPASLAQASAVSLRRCSPVLDLDADHVDFGGIDVLSV